MLAEEVLESGVHDQADVERRGFVLRIVPVADAEDLVQQEGTRAVRVLLQTGGRQWQVLQRSDLAGPRSVRHVAAGGYGLQPPGQSRDLAGQRVVGADPATGEQLLQIVLSERQGRGRLPGPGGERRRCGGLPAVLQQPR